MMSRIGLALGSGGARGFAHIGVLEILEEHGIRPAFLAGSSMGSLVASLYACGFTPSMMEKLAVHLKRKHWLDLCVPGMGFVVGEKLRHIVELLTRGKNIEELDRPLSIVAADLISGERVVFTEGPVYEAVRASVSIPGIFVPHKIGNRLLVDGGVVDRVPIELVRSMGADLTIGVDVSLAPSGSPIRSLFDVIFQTIDVMEREIFRHRTVNADIMIRPDVGRFSSTSFTNVAQIIEEGRKAARLMIPHIQEKIEEWRKQA
ncbi:patatin-like phospholipase family protein [Aneurinibacillus thermoaerophilus]|uniref:patatin-like phospholipase family protein n=1 Tax=Aneurinibacillus thermoaerophilus TaxID=143495 RepID=UPI002E1C3265|nr:patatin-like phospholipase family protein [Aneurinibacillus thermoaerophilus]MED0756746.1 patatin-like phospholipase family protein [Aneurinibacillus thermoaerophilus]MED0760796.1 patatin-like phospholipase family protein [Aneurinibacillus thermoaerophilus]